MYALGLNTRCICSNNRTISHYSIDFYKETYSLSSRTSCIIKKLAHSTLYLGNELNDMERNTHSMAFKLLKLRCPVYRVTRTGVVDNFMQNIFYGRFINNLIFYDLIISVLSSPRERYTPVNESVETSDTKRAGFEYPKNEINLRSKSNFDRVVRLRCILLIRYSLFVLVLFMLATTENKLLCSRREANTSR